MEDSGKDTNRGIISSENDEFVVIDFVVENQGPVSGEHLTGISVVDDSVVWISGNGGVFARSINGGFSWEVGKMPGEYSSLMLRDIHAVNADTAYLFSTGRGLDSKILKTNDGGVIWTSQFINREPNHFFDCFDFWIIRV